MFNTYVPTNSCRFVNYFQKVDYQTLYFELETSTSSFKEILLIEILIRLIRV
jgi:hypothetical protein